ncbi:MAG: protein phosphatase 2C domain-containing protein [Pirellulales bacterium]
MNNNASCPTFDLEYAHASDMGMRRMNNQDALAVMVTSDEAAWAARGHLFMVADGLGAPAAGELASKLAVDNIPHTYFKLRDLYPPAALRQAIRDANRVIHAKGQSSIGFQGMGTTCSCLVLLPQGALVAHIGDSRVYRLRGGLLEQLTFDHSLVWEMAAAGQIPEAEVPAYIPKNVITRSLGPHPTVNIDVEGPYNAAPGDVFLVCSDGLSGQLSDEELGAILDCLPPDEAVQSLVDLANLRGGPDNISVIAARVAGNASTPANDAEHPRPTRPDGRRWPTAPVWLAAGACLALAAYCVVHQWWLGAIVVSAVAVILVGGWAYRAGATAGAPVGSLGGPYGNGPYRKVECGPTRSVVDSLAEIAGKLRELPEKQPNNWNVDWQSFDATRKKAAAAVEADQLADAVRHYCHAVRDVMRQLRGQRPTLDGDSSGIHPTPP